MEKAEHGLLRWAAPSTQRPPFIRVWSYRMALYNLHI
jgi:hypothetical protein